MTFKAEGASVSNLFLRIIVSTFAKRLDKVEAPDNHGPALDEAIARENLERSTDVLTRVTNKVVMKSARAHARKDNQ